MPLPNDPAEYQKVKSLCDNFNEEEKVLKVEVITVCLMMIQGEKGTKLFLLK